MNMQYGIFILLAYVTPLFVQAADIEAPEDLKGLVKIFTGLIDILIPLIFALTFLTIMWGVIKAWIIQGGESDSIEEGKKIVLVGVIALVIMSSIWGILRLLQNGLFGV